MPIYLSAYPRLRLLVVFPSLPCPVRCNLGFFGGECLKPIYLFSNQSFIGDINKHTVRDWAPPSTGVVEIADRDGGGKSITGAGGLKATQTYPILFGAAFASTYAAHAGELRETAHAYYEGPFDGASGLALGDLMGARGADDWSDARLGPAIQLAMHLIVDRECAQP